ncbi:MAG: hypothetical protein AAF206_01170 [Bacteroidota bacterium]
MKARIFYHGQYIPLPIRILGLVLLIVGLMLYQNGHLWAFEMIRLGAMSWLIWKGLEIDPEEKMLREFVYILGMREGSWTFLARYPDLVLLRDQTPTDKNPIATAMIIGGDGAGSTYRPDEYHKQELFVATPTHLDLKLVKSFKSRRKAMQLADELAD